MHKNPPKNRRFRSKIGEIARVPIDDGLSGLRAVRDDAPILAVAQPIQVDEEDAIDRLLAVSGFDNPVTGTALASSSIGPISATDDFEPVMTSAFLVGSIDQDPPFQMQPLNNTVVDAYEANLNQHHFDHINHPVDPVGQEDFVHNGLDEKTRMPSLQDVSTHQTGNEISHVSFDEPLIFNDDFTLRRKEQTGQFERHIEPAVDIAVHAAEIVHEDVDSGREQAVALSKVDLIHDAKNNYSSGQADEPLPDNNPEYSPTPYLCGFKTEVARINLITLVFSIVTSLASIVLYFMLMDMRDDLIKLNEMVDIMKDDLQMSREEPPVE